MTVAKTNWQTMPFRLPITFMPEIYTVGASTAMHAGPQVTGELYECNGLLGFMLCTFRDVRVCIHGDGKPQLVVSKPCGSLKQLYPQKIQIEQRCATTKKTLGLSQ